MRSLTFGFTPCPNDAFAFHALVHGLVEARFVVEPVLLDIEELNQRARTGELDLTKLSFGAAPRRASSTGCSGAELRWGMESGRWWWPVRSPTGYERTPFRAVTQLPSCSSVSRGRSSARSSRCATTRSWTRSHPGPSTRA